jgi:hypothetical protein
LIRQHRPAQRGQLTGPALRETLLLQSDHRLATLTGI